MRAAWLAGLLLCGPALAQAPVQVQGQAPGPVVAQDEACPDAKVPPLALPRLKDAVVKNHQVTVVTLGSSSTEGVRASDKWHSYPAVLQRSLNAALKTAHVAVLNRGVGGQDVTEELPRLERDVLGVRPTLVIWQLGANGAMRHMSPDLFKKLLTSGVHRLHEARVDVVLMDNQRAPNIISSPEHAKFDQAMADVAVATGAGLFGRGALMDQWRQGGQAYSQFMSEDGVHHNDRGYRCVAQTLARAIIEGLGPTPVANPAAVTQR